MATTELTNITLQLEAAMTDEDVIRCEGMWSTIERTFKEMRAAYLDARLEAVDRLGGVNLPSGKRLYVGTTKRTKCNDKRRTIEALFNATGGDIDATAECLSSNAFKHGACREPLGDEWDEHFTVEEIRDVKTGKAKKSVQIADERYTKAS